MKKSSHMETKSFTFSQKQVFLIFGLLGLTLGLATVSLSSLKVAPYLFLLIFLLLATFFIYQLPKTFLLLFGLFLLFQDLLIQNFGGRGSFTGEFLARVENFVLVWTFLLIVFLKLFTRKNLLLPFLPFLALFVATGMLANLWQKTPFYVTILGVFLTIRPFIVFYLFANLKWTITDFLKIKKYILIFGVIFLIGAVFDFLNPSVFRDAINNKDFLEIRAGLPSVQSFFSHPSFFASVMSFIAIFLLASYYLNQRLTTATGSFIFFLASVLSLRLKPLISFPAAALLGALSLKKKRLNNILAVILIFCLFLLFFGNIAMKIFLHRYSTYIIYGESNKEARNLLYETSLKIALDNFPLGVGFGRFGSWTSVLFYSPVYTQYGLDKIYGLTSSNPGMAMDTFWPTILGETGFLGLIFYLTLIFRLIRLLQGFLKNNKLDFKIPTLAAFMVFIGALGETLSYQSLFKMPDVYLVFGFIGIAYALNKRGQSVN